MNDNVRREYIRARNSPGGTVHPIPGEPQRKRYHGERVVLRRDGLFEVALNVFPNGGMTNAPRADKALFGNTAGFNHLLLVTDMPPPRETWDDWYYLGANAHGIIIGYDTVEQRDDRTLNPFGFHNFLIPWARIAYCYQYIQT